MKKFFQKYLKKKIGLSPFFFQIDHTFFSALDPRRGPWRRCPTKGMAPPAMRSMCREVLARPPWLDAFDDDRAFEHPRGTILST